MGRLFKPTITRYVDADGRRCRKGDPGARKKRVKSRTWRGEYTDADGNRESVGLCSNKEAARHLLHELETRVALGRAGLVDSFEEHHKQPLSEHLADFIGTLRDSGRSEDYLQPVEARVRKIIEGCKFRLIFDISASRVQAFLADLKRSGMGHLSTNTSRNSTPRNGSSSGGAGRDASMEEGDETGKKKILKSEYWPWMQQYLKREAKAQGAAEEVQHLISNLCTIGVEQALDYAYSQSVNQNNEGVEYSI